VAHLVLPDEVHVLPSEAPPSTSDGRLYSLGRDLESKGQPVLMSGYLCSIGFGYPAPPCSVSSRTPNCSDDKENRRTDYTDLRAMFINCTLKRSPERSNTEGLIDVSKGILEKNGVRVEVLRAIDHEIAIGVWPDMTEHGWERDAWPAIYERVLASDILVLAGPIWLGDNSSVMKQVIERLYACSHLLNDVGQYAYYGRVGGCLITGNEDGVKHCAMNVLYSLQHLGYTIPPQADAGWIGEAGPGPSYLDPGSGGPENDFTNRNTTFMTWNLMHLARMLKDAGGIPAHGNQRSEWDAGCRFDFDNPDYR
jgi:multimeric flavodoxin WrbA